MYTLHLFRGANVLFSMPLRRTMFFPMTDTCDLSSSTMTSANSESSATTLSIFCEASTVTDIFASDVLMRSTETLFSLNISKTLRKNPDVLIILIEKMLITRMFSLYETDFTPSSISSLRRMAVPLPEGFIEFRTKIGIFFLTAGSMVRGWSTFAPKWAISAASSKEIFSRYLVFFT